MNGVLDVAEPGFLADNFSTTGPLTSMTLLDGPDHGTLSNNLIDGRFRYTPNANFIGVDTVMVSVNDGTHVKSETYTINVYGPNDAPVVDLDANNNNGTGINYSPVTPFVEDAAGIAIADNDLTITDDDNANLASVTITLTNHQALDSLSVSGALPGGIVASAYNALTGVLTLSNSASKADYATAIAQIRFATTSENPGTADRVITVVATDTTGGVGSPATATLNVSAVNDAPTFVVGPGKFTTDFAAATAGTALQADGKIVILGTDSSIARYNSDGTLDASFGSGGVVAAGALADGVDLLIQPDGKILVAGTSTAFDSDFSVVRFNSDGSIDTTFGGGDGKGTIHVDGTAGPTAQNFPRAIALQSDGKIVVIGSVNNGLGAFQDYAAVRFNADGTPDAGFGTGGAMFTPVATTTDEANSVAIQSDGKILIAGQGFDFGSDATIDGLVRLNPDGSVDKIIKTSWGNRQDDVIYDVVLQPDGKAVIVGSTHNNDTNPGDGGDIILQRYTTALDPSDPLDHTFGMSGSGRVVVNLGISSFDEGVRALILPDGKIMVGATTSAGGHTLLALVRFNADGSFDTTFGDGGKVTTQFAGTNPFAIDMVMQPDGKLVVTGNLGSFPGDGIAVVRYNFDGSIDQTLRAVNTLDGAPTYVTGGAPVVLDSDVLVYDAELQLSANGYFDATLTLARDGGADPSDVFGFNSGVTLASNIVSVDEINIAVVNQNSGGQLQLRFLPSARQDTVDAVMHAITYSNNAANPPSSVQIDWTFSDGNTTAQGPGGAKTATGSTTVTIQPDPDATPHWTKSVGIAPHPAGWSPAGIGDFNADGTSDIAWYNSSTGNIDIWKFANDQWEASVDAGSHPGGYQPVSFADFNHDNTGDVLWYNPATGQVDLWKIANGQWAGSVDIGTHPTGWQPAGFGDFNGDGTSDIAWYNPTTNAIDIWKIVDGQWAGSVDVGSHPAGYQPALTGDFNGDGTSDIAWFNPTTGDVDIWQLSDGQWAGSTSVGAHPAGWQPLGAADFNLDGTSDIAWYNPTTNNIDVWLVDNGQWTASVDIGTHPAGWVAVGVGDFDNNGVSDIMWHNPSTGEIDNWMLAST